MFSSNKLSCFVFSSFTFRALVHFELIWYMAWGQVSIWCFNVDSQLSQYFLSLFFSYCVPLPWYTFWKSIDRSIATLCIILKHWKQPCSLTKKNIQTLWNIRTIEYYAGVFTNQKMYKYIMEYPYNRILCSNCKEQMLLHTK